MKFFVFGASLRKESLNRKLGIVVEKVLAGTATIDRADFREFAMPVFDEDLETADGMPKGADALVARITASDGLVVSTPEYNGSIPGGLKNALDWVSRADVNPLAGKPVLLLGTSPGALGAVRGLWHARVPFEVLGAHVYPEMFGLPKASDAFSEDGRLTDARMQARLEKLLGKYQEFVQIVKG